MPHTRARDRLSQKVGEQLCRNKRRRLDHKKQQRNIVNNLQSECGRGIHANDLTVFDGGCVMLLHTRNQMYR